MSNVISILERQLRRSNAVAPIVRATGMTFADVDAVMRAREERRRVRARKETREMQLPEPTRCEACGGVVDPRKRCGWSADFTKVWHEECC